MIKIRFILMFMFFLCLCLPAYRVIAQDSGPETQQSVVQTDENNDTKEKKAEKKKNKDKVEINWKFFFCLLINIATLVIILLLVYYPNNRQMESIFTFLMFNLMIFMLTFVLNKIKISMGAAFGLFAVFSMLRYRTEGISMKDMTYLFVFIAVGLISAIQLEYYELGIINGVIILFIFILDSKFFFKRELSKNIEYENIELIKPDNCQLLIEDIKKRTGLNVHRINIEKINFLRDTANIKIYYYE